MNPNWNSQGDGGGPGGGGLQTERPSVGRVWKFSGTTQSQLCDYFQSH